MDVIASQVFLMLVMKVTYGFPYNHFLPRPRLQHDLREPSIEDMLLSQDDIFNHRNQRNLPVFVNKVSIPEAIRMIEKIQGTKNKRQWQPKVGDRSSKNRRQRMARKLIIDALLDDIAFTDTLTDYGVDRPVSDFQHGIITQDKKREKRAVVDPIEDQSGFGGFSNDRSELQRNLEYLLRLHQQQDQNSESSTVVPYAFEVLFPILHRNID